MQLKRVPARRLPPRPSSGLDGTEKDTRNESLQPEVMPEKSELVRRLVSS